MRAFSKAELSQKVCMLMRTINWYRRKMQLVNDKIEDFGCMRRGGVQFKLLDFNSIRAVQPLKQE